MFTRDHPVSDPDGDILPCVGMIGKPKAKQNAAASESQAAGRDDDIFQAAGLLVKIQNALGGFGDTRRERELINLAGSPERKPYLFDDRDHDCGN
jgi:hypothetical protein